MSQNRRALKSKPSSRVFQSEIIRRGNSQGSENAFTKAIMPAESNNSCLQGISTSIELNLLASRDSHLLRIQSFSALDERIFSEGGAQYQTRTRQEYINHSNLEQVNNLPRIMSLDFLRYCDCLSDKSGQPEGGTPSARRCNIINTIPSKLQCQQDSNINMDDSFESYRDISFSSSSSMESGVSKLQIPHFKDFGQKNSFGGKEPTSRRSGGKTTELSFKKLNFKDFRRQLMLEAAQENQQSSSTPKTITDKHSSNRNTSSSFCSQSKQQTKSFGIRSKNRSTTNISNQENSQDSENVFAVDQDDRRFSRDSVFSQLSKISFISTNLNMFKNKVPEKPQEQQHQNELINNRMQRMTKNHQNKMSSFSKFYKIVEVKNSNSESDMNSDRRDSKPDKDSSVFSQTVNNTPSPLDMNNKSGRCIDRSQSFDLAFGVTSKDDQMKLKQILLKNHIKNNRHLILDSSDNNDDVVDDQEGEISHSSDDGCDIQSDIVMNQLRKPIKQK